MTGLQKYIFLQSPAASEPWGRDGPAGWFLKPQRTLLNHFCLVAKAKTEKLVKTGFKQILELGTVTANGTGTDAKERPSTVAQKTSKRNSR